MSLDDKIHFINAWIDLLRLFVWMRQEISTIVSMIEHIGDIFYMLLMCNKQFFSPRSSHQTCVLLWSILINFLLSIKQYTCTTNGHSLFWKLYKDLNWRIYEEFNMIPLPTYAESALICILSNMKLTLIPLCYKAVWIRISIPITSFLKVSIISFV